MSHAHVLVAIDPTFDIEEAVSYQMAPFDEDGAWFAEGTRWDWWQIGGRYSGMLAGADTIRRRDIDLAALRAHTIARRTDTYRRAMGEAMSPDSRAFVYGVKPDETLDDYLARTVQHDFPPFHAFLRNRVWQEKARLGWFGVSTATECEVAGVDAHICKHEGNGARIVSWSDSASWDKMLYPRFVEPLPPETMLVVVDYHV